MKRIVYLLLLAVLLAACGPSDTPAATNEPAESTEQSNITEQSGAADSEDSEPVSSASTESFKPAVTPEEAALIREQDHVLGAEEPAVSIIEYGDFQ